MRTNILPRANSPTVSNISVYRNPNSLSRNTRTANLSFPAGRRPSSLAAAARAASAPVSASEPVYEPVNSIANMSPYIDVHLQIRAERNAYREDPSEIITFREYSRGKHRSVLTTKQKLILRNLIGSRFCDNAFHQIIAEATDRIEFRRWTCQDEDIQLQLNDFYNTARVANRQGEINYDALRDGNTAVALNYDLRRQEVQLYREDWWDGHQGVFIFYDALDNPYLGVKDWYETVYNTAWDPGFNTAFGGWWGYAPNVNTSVVFRDIWYEDRLERWMSHNGGSSWVPYTLPSDNGQWPRPWLKKDGSPLHIPYVHFPNSGRGTGNYGLSEGDGGVVGVNDQLNDLHWAMSAAGRLTAYQMIAVSGATKAVDANGKETPFEVGPGQVLASSSPNTKWTTIHAGDLSQLIKLFDKKLSRLAQMTRTPLHMIGGEWPSGDAILRAEKPAVGKANRQVRQFADCWRMVGHKYTELWNRFGPGPELSEDYTDSMIGCIFASTERRDPLSNSLIVNNLSNFISSAEALRLMDYSDDDAEAILYEKEEEDLRAVALFGGPIGAEQSDPLAPTEGGGAGTTPNTVPSADLATTATTATTTTGNSSLQKPGGSGGNGRRAGKVGSGGSGGGPSQVAPQGRGNSIVRGNSLKPVKAKGAIVERRLRRDVGPGINS